MSRKRVSSLTTALFLMSSCATTPTFTPHEAAPQRTAASAVNVSGEWQLNVFARGGVFREKLFLAQVGTIVTGHTESGTISTLHGSIQPPDIAWTTGVDKDGVVKQKEIPTEYRGTVSGDSMEGVANLGVFGEAAWSAERVKR